MQTAYDFSQGPEMISELEPSGRVWGREHNLNTNEYYQRVLSDPVYFSAQVPRSFDNAKVTIEYDNAAQPLVELGLEKYGEGNFELKPLENKAIDNLDWPYIEEGSVRLYQKEETYETIGDFVNNLPKDKKIATYHYDLFPEVAIEDYEPRDEIKDISANLIGDHEFVFYVGEEDPYIQFNIRHLDEQGEIVPVNMKVKKGGVTILEETFQENTKEVDLTDVGPGILSVSLAANDNTCIDYIRTNLQKMVLKTKIYPGGGENVNIHTESMDINLRPWIASGLQTALVNGRELALNKVNKLFNWRDSDDKSVLLPAGNVEIIGDGYFALSKDMYFNPNGNIEKLQCYSDIDEFDYVIVDNYAAPRQQKNIIAATQEFSLEGVPGDRKELNFVISAPGLEEAGEDIIVHKITIELERPPLWKKLLK